MHVYLQEYFQSNQLANEAEQSLYTENKHTWQNSSFLVISYSFLFFTVVLKYTYIAWTHETCDILFIIQYTNSR